MVYLFTTVDRYRLIWLKISIKYWFTVDILKAPSIHESSRKEWLNCPCPCILLRPSSWNTGNSDILGYNLSLLSLLGSHMLLLVILSQTMSLVISRSCHFLIVCKMPKCISVSYGSTCGGTLYFFHIQTGTLRFNIWLM